MPTTASSSPPGSCPATCSAPSSCPLSVLSSEGWSGSSGASLLAASWPQLTGGTDVLVLGSAATSPGGAAAGLLFDSPDSVTCFLARQVAGGSADGDQRLGFPLKGAVNVSLPRGQNGSCPAGAPTFGAASSWVADVLALKLNVLYTRMLSAMTGAPGLEGGLISSSYSVPECTCRTVGGVLDRAQQYLAGMVESADGAPAYDVCAADIVLQFGDAACGTSPYSDWLCLATSRQSPQQQQQLSTPPPLNPPTQPLPPDAPAVMPPGQEGLLLPPPRPAGSRSPFPFGSCLAEGSNVGRPFLLGYANSSLNPYSGDWSYCFDVAHADCSKTRCCGIPLEQIQFLIDDYCYGAVYDLTVNGRPRSASYNVYDVRGYTYTVLKFTALNLPYEDAQGAEICFSLKSSVCADVATMCGGPSCSVAMGNTPGMGGGNSCCVPQKLTVA
ncbi:hypothetical protein GPECTOR_506g472 [Gonium pectorale]|uniref:Pherophorin domain-containing protein n=1 Tax=Gonium pectorale TaxID=33097 RepID=A0A150FUS6_GONPE|nr:hypothetical protein GPECTOR_506g472 [Gonium pectorale]|eukprot:KXZ41383.1 hypothetical protein GPECTOR_506g472 [Gonium pectorale]